MHRVKALRGVVRICLAQVIESIKDNIREHELLDYLERVFYHISVSLCFET